MSTDAIVLLKNDHKEVKALFRQFQGAGEDAHELKGKLVQQIIELLSVHTYVENKAFYPTVREYLPGLTKDILESYEEHHVVDWLCKELAEMDPRDESFDAKATVLIENVSHHVEEEETGWFPKVRDGLTRTQLKTIGEEMLELKKPAPRSPSRSRTYSSARAKTCSSVAPSVDCWASGFSGS